MTPYTIQKFMFVAAKVKATWKGLRDTFLKNKKLDEESKRSGAGAGQDPSWRWWKQMAWLRPYLGNSRLMIILFIFR